MSIEQAHTIWILIAFAIVLVAGVVAAVIADRKQRSSGAWFVLGVMFPLLGVLVISALEPLPSRARPSFMPPVGT
jgi:cytochrome bd-type quinol oxidase subunit 2